jgi:hypothetical protein
MNPPPLPISHVTAANAYAFTPAELARLVAYRGAIAAGLYSDFPTPNVHTAMTPNRELLIGTGTPPDDSGAVAFMRREDNST